MIKSLLVLAAPLTAWALWPSETATNYGLTPGTPEIQVAGQLAFGPDGLLLVADPKGASVFAISTKEKAAKAAKAAKKRADVDKLGEKLAGLLGTTADAIVINDLAVHPQSSEAYLSITRGSGDDAAAAIVRVAQDGALSVVSLEDVEFAQAKLGNAPADEGTGRRNKRTESITDLGFVDGKIVVAGLSNEEFASKLRFLAFPFEEVAPGTSVEIYHASHGEYETRAPVRAFTVYEPDGKPEILAGYTCTPLVRFPVSDLESGKKVRGTTVAELGNWNRPIDMLVYEKGGEEFLLIANSARGMMKMPTKGLVGAEAMSERVREPAGVGYETIESMQGVVQMSKLDDESVLCVIQTEDELSLKTVPTP